ncbi:MAG: N-acetyltransferase [Deltaproteobacteria bacterium]|nr:N-acetyltransferase [Deltaproteobacteria bacterium]
MIRKASLKDVKKIHALISEQAKGGHLLARAIADLYSQIRDFSVAVDDDTGEIIGCGALRIVWEDLAEVRSVAVQSQRQGKGVGRKLIETLIEESRTLGIKKVFVLTYRVNLFSKMGFSLMDKGLLPHKIWADCVKCPKFPECDEVAMVMEPNHGSDPDTK